MVGTVQDITESRRIEDELRSLSRRLVRIQEEERRNVARELHDEIGQSLTVLILMLDIAKRLSTGDAASTLVEAEELVNGLMEQVRKLSLELRPGMLDDLGLLPTLLWHFDNYTTKTRIKVNFKHSGLQVPFSSEVKIAAYRIVQEALTNILRYAGVREIDVTAWTDQQLLWIRIEDKGKGFDLKSISPGTSGGLFGMYERANSLNGELIVDSSPGQGTTIVTRLPLSDSSTTSKEDET
jgi:signal transduction histidine kinase